MNKEHAYAILGGGIGGLTLALAMQNKGMDVTVYESAPQWKPLGAGLGLAGNAVKAFREIGLEQEILEVGKVIRQVTIKDPRGNALLMTDSERVSRQYGVVNNFAIHRADLHNVLLARLKPQTVILGKACVDFEQGPHGVNLKFSDGTTTHADYVIASDGIHSVVRKKLVTGSAPRYAGYTAWRAVIDDLPAGFNTEETSETWGQGTRFGIVPLKGNRVYWFACINASANNAVMKSLSPGELLTFFRDFHHPIPGIIKATPKENLIWNDIIDIRPLRRFAFGNIVLMGDAAHAATPNLGQGACMAIEDAVVLANLLDVSADPETAFRNFEEKRIRRTTKIVNDSWRLGKVAQLGNPILSKVRNLAFRSMPASMTDKQFKFIYDVALH